MAPAILGGVSSSGGACPSDYRCFRDLLEAPAEALLAALQQHKLDDANLRHPLENRRNRMHYAAARPRDLGGSAALAQRLGELGVKHDTPDDTGQTPLFFAAREGNCQCVEYLASRCCKLDHRDKHGQTALFYTALKGWPETVTMLHGLGASSNLADNKGRTALFYAALGGHADCTNLLVQHGCCVNHTDNRGQTPLFYAVRGGGVKHADVIRDLVQLRADCFVQDAESKTARMYAQSVPVHRALAQVEQVSRSGNPAQQLCAGAAESAERVVHWGLVAESPRIYVAQGFLTDSECDAVYRLAGVFGDLTGRRNSFGLDVPFPKDETCQGLCEEGKVGEEDYDLVNTLLQRRSGLTDESGAARVDVRITPKSREGNQLGDLLIPMHVDTLVQNVYLTIIVYLRTVPPAHGGHTLFPLATWRCEGQSSGQSVNDLLELAEDLIQRGSYGQNGLDGHEGREAPLNTAAMDLAKAAVTAAADGGNTNGVFWGDRGHGLAFAARKGDAVCFFTRRQDGEIDPASWHSVASVGADMSERATAQFWHKLPEGSRGVSCPPSFQLRPCTAGGVRFEIVEGPRPPQRPRPEPRHSECDTPLTAQKGTPHPAGACGGFSVSGILRSDSRDHGVRFGAFPKPLLYGVGSGMPDKGLTLNALAGRWRVSTGSVVTFTADGLMAVNGKDADPSRRLLEYTNEEEVTVGILHPDGWQMNMVTSCVDFLVWERAGIFVEWRRAGSATPVSIEPTSVGSERLLRPSPDVLSLRRLAGQWQATTGTVWTITGDGRTLQRGRSTTHEMQRLEEHGCGADLVVRRPDGWTVNMKRSSPSTLVWENGGKFTEWHKASREESPQTSPNAPLPDTVLFDFDELGD